MLKLFTWAQAYGASLRDREEGQTMAEYGVVLTLITLGVVAAIGLLAAAIAGKLGAVTGILGG